MNNNLTPRRCTRSGRRVSFNAFTVSAGDSRRLGLLEAWLAARHRTLDAANRAYMPWRTGAIVPPPRVPGKRLLLLGLQLLILPLVPAPSCPGTCNDCDDMDNTAAACDADSTTSCAGLSITCVWGAPNYVHHCGCACRPGGLRRRCLWITPTLCPGVMATKTKAATSTTSASPTWAWTTP